MSERKLLRVVKIDNVIPHDNADSLELAIVGGWQVCVKKDQFKAGDVAMYAEVDALLPLDHPEFAFLEGRSQYTVDGKNYSRVKTIKLRKQLSQGILFDYFGTAGVDEDLTSLYGVIKYEAVPEPVPGSGNGVKKARAFPSFIRKTDQERVQNIVNAYNAAVATGEEFEVSVKLDGSSFTAYIKDGKVGVCSRNIELQLEPETWSLWKQLTVFVSEVKKHGFKYAKWKKGVQPEANAFTALFNELELETALRAESAFNMMNFAIQGEMVGPSIQGNFEGVDKNRLFVYSVFDIDAQKYLVPEAAYSIVKRLGLEYVPVISYRTTLPETVAEVLAMADGPSALGGKYREGLVFKSLDRDFSFKVISNEYLLKEK
jgi:RNA ligase (TIGR02306 family)